MLCSKLHCQKGFDFIPFSYKIASPQTRTKPSFLSPMIHTTVAPDSGESQHKSRASKTENWSLRMFMHSSIS